MKKVPSDKSPLERGGPATAGGGSGSELKLVSYTPLYPLSRGEFLELPDSPILLRFGIHELKLVAMESNEISPPGTQRAQNEDSCNRVNQFDPRFTRVKIG